MQILYCLSRNIKRVKLWLLVVHSEIDIEKCVHDSIKIFCSTPKSATFRQYAMIQKDVTPRRVVHSYYTQDYHETPKTELVSFSVVRHFT